MGGFRFWTAAHIFIYGCLHYFYKYKTKRVLWAFISPFLIHYAFLLPVFILVFFILFGAKLRLYYAFFIISIFISEVNVEALNSVIENYTPEYFQERTISYRSDSALEKFEEQQEQTDKKVWYAEYQNKFIIWPLMLILAISFWAFKRAFRIDKNLYIIFSFTYLFFGASNILANLPSAGRFQNVAILFCLSALIIFLQNINYNKTIVNVLRLSTPLLLLFIIVSVREGFYLTSLMTIVGNPIVAVFSIGENISLNDIIK
jgi:hypothetical protein